MVTPDGNTDHELAEELLQLVQSLAAAGHSILPQTPDTLLKSIVEAAARIFRAAAASIMLVDEAEGMLEFKVAYGASDRDLVGTRIPINQGIAGYVAMSGQPIAVSDVAQDTRFNQAFAKSTGYVPRSILATPLISGERVIGVMEVLDKIDAPSFGMQDMELLGIFARQAALAIDQSQSLDNLETALLAGLHRLAVSDPDHPSPHLQEILNKNMQGMGQNAMLKLADLLTEFGRMGDEERDVALKVLSAFAEYNQNRRRFSAGVMK